MIGWRSMRYADMVEWGGAFMQCYNNALRQGVGVGVGVGGMTGSGGEPDWIDGDATVQFGGVWTLLDV